MMLISKCICNRDSPDTAHRLITASRPQAVAAAVLMEVSRPVPPAVSQRSPEPSRRSPVESPDQRSASRSPCYPPSTRWRAARSLAYAHIPPASISCTTNRKSTANPQNPDMSWRCRPTVCCCSLRLVVHLGNRSSGVWALATLSRLLIASITEMSRLSEMLTV